MLDLSHRPNVLYLASIERMNAARRMIDEKPHDYVLAGYLAGLAVEAMLQSLALRAGAAHDARHSLDKWLIKCPWVMQDVLKGSNEWSFLAATWDNGMRYLSFEGLAGYYKQKGYGHGKKGGVESLVRQATNHLVDTAQVVHKKGLVVWESSTRK